MTSGPTAVAGAVFALPPGFLIGAATSGHQTEGNNLGSDLWELENAPGSPIAERSGDACDSYHRWREDMELAAGAGLNAYRFGVEWARVEPVAGRFSQAEILHYAEMVRYAVSLGLEPVVTLHHFTSPAWFSAAGGWCHEDAAALFTRYIDALEPVLTAGVTRIVTINEPNMVSMMAAIRSGEAGLENGLGGGLLPTHQPTAEAIIAVHRAARAHLKENYPEAQVGWSIANQAVVEGGGGPAGALAYRERIEDQFLRASDGDDFVGVQTYTRNIVNGDGTVHHPEGARRTLTGWEFYPGALELAVRHTAEVLPGLGILVTENGIATDDDAWRIEYTAGALAGLSAAMSDGIEVQGYLHWSLLDNYEWGSWGPTFGLVAVDRETFARTPKPSLAWLGEWAKRGALPAA